MTKSRREILAEAFDASDTAEDEQPTRKPEDEEEIKETPTEDEGQDTGEGTSKDEGEEGKEPKKESTDETERKAAEAALANEKISKPGSSEKEQPRNESIATRAPNSWTPAAREDWSKIPAGARAQILKREREIESKMSEVAGLQNFSNKLAQIIQPHLPFIQAQRSNPLAAIENLFGTASQLYSGNQETKAAVVAQLIWNYGIDIPQLDKILSTKQLPTGQTQAQFQKVPDAPPAWAQPLFNFVTEAQQARQQAQQRELQESQAEIERVKDSWPFFEDVRQEMADLMEAAFNRGRVMSLKQAYDTVIGSNEELSKIIKQRNIASRQQADLTQKRRAASTIKGAPSGGRAGGSSAKTSSRREALERAWEEAESG